MQSIKMLRERAGITQGQLAEKMNVDRTTVGKWDAGRTPTAAKLPRLAAVLGVTVDELLREPSGGAAAGNEEMKE